MQHSAALPPGWYEGVDPHYNRVYYFDKTTRRSTWTKPQFDAVLAELNQSEQLYRESKTQNIYNPPRPEESPRSMHQINQPNSERYYTSPRRNDFAVNPATAYHQPHLPPPPQAPPPHDARSAYSSTDPWVEVFSAEHNRVYYYNKVTRQSVWVDPRTPPAANPANVVHAPPPPANLSRQSDSFSSSNPSVNQPDTVIDQIPALQNAWREIMSARRALEREREMHDMRMKGEWKNLRVQLQEMKELASKEDALRQKSSGKNDDSSGFSDRRLSLTHELEEYAQEINERSRQLAEQMSATPALRRGRRASVETADAAASVVSEAAQLQGHNKYQSEPKQAPLPLFADEELPKHPAITDALESELIEMQNTVKHMQREIEAQKAAREEALFVDEKGGYYNVLGVEVDCTSAQLKKAHRKMMMKWHPDKNRDNREEAQKMASLIQTAFEALNDPWHRSLYDWLKLDSYLQHVKIITCFQNYLNTGLYVKKHGRKGLKYFPKKRFLWTDRECTIINTAKQRIVEATKEQEQKIKSVKICDIIDVKKGISTDVLKKLGTRSSSSKYFSIITEDRTLDLIASTKSERDFLASRLIMLVIESQQNMEWLQDFYKKQRGG